MLDTNLQNQLLQEMGRLPVPLQQRVVDFARDLAQSASPKPAGDFRELFGTMLHGRGPGNDAGN